MAHQMVLIALVMIGFVSLVSAISHSSTSMLGDPPVAAPAPGGASSVKGMIGTIGAAAGSGRANSLASLASPPGLTNQAADHGIEVNSLINSIGAAAGGDGSHVDSLASLAAAHAARGQSDDQDQVQHPHPPLPHAAAADPSNDATASIEVSGIARAGAAIVAGYFVFSIRLRLR